ncbi:hypothetical protein [Euzebya sp.]|uniref:hypothetical protein n=1 Tax=Euzebya sp. TaxID=1971409 RepID=UPI00351794B5
MTLGDVEGVAPGTVVGVDLGLRTGVAVLDGVVDGPVRLRRYTSTHIGSRSALRRGAVGMLAEVGPIAVLAVEGDEGLARIWERAARGTGAEVVRVHAERWREVLLLPRERRTGKLAKAAAQAKAVRVIEWSRANGGRAPAPVGPLRHDTADAIMIAVWAAVALGGVEVRSLPFDVPG